MWPDSDNDVKAGAWGIKLPVKDNHEKSWNENHKNVRHAVKPSMHVSDVTEIISSSCRQVYTNRKWLLFISLIRMRSKRDIKMGRLCTPGGAVLGIVGGGCDVPFFKWWGYSWRKYAILGAFIRSCGCLENPTRFQTIMVKIIWAFWKKSLAFGVPPAYSKYRRFRPRGENWLILC